MFPVCLFAMKRAFSDDALAVAVRLARRYAEVVKPCEGHAKFGWREPGEDGGKRTEVMVGIVPEGNVVNSLSVAHDACVCLFMYVRTHKVVKHLPFYVGNANGLVPGGIIHSERPGKEHPQAFFKVGLVGGYLPKVDDKSNWKVVLDCQRWQWLLFPLVGNEGFMSVYGVVAHNLSSCMCCDNTPQRYGIYLIHCLFWLDK